MEFDNHEEFFGICGQCEINFHREPDWPVTIEEMYQHFKARMIEEVRVKSPELLDTGELVDMVTP